VYLTRLHNNNYLEFQMNVPSPSSRHTSCHSCTLDTEPATPSYQATQYHTEEEKQSSVSNLFYIHHTEASFLSLTLFSFQHSYPHHKKKVNQSRYRPGVAQRVPGSYASQIT
jgi:hypothetical protein